MSKPRKSRAVAIALGLSVSLSIGPVFARSEPSEASDSLRVLQGDTVRVTGRPLHSAGVSITNVETRTTFASGSSTAGEMLKSAPGVLVTTGYKNTTELRIRGFEAREVLVTIDGWPVNPGYYGKVDLSLLPLNGTSSMEVVRGPASAAYGPNASGGILNVQTFNELEATTWRADLRYGSAGFTDLTLAGAGRASGLRYDASFFRTHGDGFPLAKDFHPTVGEDGGVREQSDFVRTGANLRVVGPPSPLGRLTLRAGQLWAEKGIPQSTLDTYAWRMTDIRHSYAAVESEARLSDSLSMKTGLFYDAWQDVLTEYATAEIDPADARWCSELENWSASARSRWNWAVSSGLRLRCGAAYIKQVMNKQPDRDEPWYSHNASELSGFAESEAWITDRFDLVTGVGVSAHNIPEGKTRAAIEPLARLRFAALRNLKLGFAASRSVSYPALHQLYSETSGNASLGPATTVRWEMAAELEYAGGGHARAAVFGNHLNDMIQRDGRLAVYRNLQQASTGGAELAAEVGQRWWTLRAEYSYLRVFDGSAATILYVPKHKWDLGLSCEPHGRVVLRGDLLYSGPRVADTRGGTLPGFTLVDGSVEWRVNRHVTATAGVRNAFDTNYLEEVGFPGPGRRLTAGLSVTL